MLTEENNPEDISIFIEQWKDRNRAALPVNFNAWNASLIPPAMGNTATPAVAIDKFNSLRHSATAFYKPISRVSKFDFDE